MGWKFMGTAWGQGPLGVRYYLDNASSSEYLSSP